MGGQKGIASFYEAFSQLANVTLISTNNNDKPTAFHGDFLPVLPSTKMRYINFLFFFKLAKIIQERKATHLICEHPYLGWLGILAKYFCKTQLVIHSHNIESLRFKSTGKWWWKCLWHYERLVHRIADVNFFITDEDRLFAIKHFNLVDTKCHTITYGFDFNKVPTEAERQEAKNVLHQKHQIPLHHTLLLFNGTLDYGPNLDALNTILNNINPVFLANPKFEYAIIICGKGLPDAYQQLESYKNKHIVYAGFVDDIRTYFKGSDIFLNPLVDGGGIKTKLVEALGYNLTCISTVPGAIGVPVRITGNKLHIIEPNNWTAFATKTMEIDKSNGKVDAPFFTHFFWTNIAEKAIMAIIS